MMTASRSWEASNHCFDIVFPIRGHPATDGAGGGIIKVWFLNWVTRLAVPSTIDLISQVAGKRSMTRSNRVNRTPASVFLFPSQRFTLTKKGYKAMAMMAPPITGWMKGSMIPMHQAMSRKRITILRMVSIKGDSTVLFICLLLTDVILMFRQR